MSGHSQAKFFHNIDLLIWRQRHLSINLIKYFILYSLHIFIQVWTLHAADLSAPDIYFPFDFSKHVYQPTIFIRSAGYDLNI